MEDKRSIYYKLNQVNIRGEIYGKTEERTGFFISFAADYTLAVIETEYGEVIRVPISDVRFVYPGVY